jgi:hypothetical protein
MQAGRKGTGPCFRPTVVEQEDVASPKNGPVPVRPVNGYVSGRRWTGEGEPAVTFPSLDLGFVTLCTVLWTCTCVRFSVARGGRIARGVFVPRDGETGRGEPRRHGGGREEACPLFRSLISFPFRRRHFACVSDQELSQRLTVDIGIECAHCAANRQIVNPAAVAAADTDARFGLD